MLRTVAIAALLASAPALAAQTVRVTGSYAVDRGNEAGCVLDVRELIGGRAHFALECSRGAPSYNSGYIEGFVSLRGSDATFVTTAYGGRCELRFRFAGDAVTVAHEEEGGGCGFGYGVHADGAYRRTAPAPTGAMRDGRKT
jgi:hypothetical protein